jgi:hypothetical protein
LERHRAWLAGLEPGERARIELLTRGLVNKLLHRVLCGLRESRGGADNPAYAAEIARRLLVAELDDAQAMLEDGDDDEDL